VKIYKVERQIIAEKLKGLFSYKGVANQDKKDLIDSLTLFGKTNFSIVDCILCARSINSKMPLFTFDDELKKISNTASSKR
jgi:predicted nucleic-acid-binding protein